MLRIACVAAATLLAACATAESVRMAAPAVAVSADELATADRLVEEGCYHCLQDALDLYERAGAADRVFSTALLVAAREKELGLDSEAWLQKARALATPATIPYVDIVASLPWTTVGAAPDFDQPPRPPALVLQEWLDLLNRGEVPSILEQYLLIALTCGRQQDTPGEEGLTLEYLILRYRLGICGPSHRAHLDTVFASSPRFSEAGLYLARYEMTNSGYAGARVTRALPLLVAAHDSIPESPLIAVTLGGVWSARKEYARALSLFDEVLARRVAHRDALLGRASVLTYLGRTDEAIAAASRMIELGTWYLGDAYYWRAWNLYSTGRLGNAADDVASARRYQSGPDVLTLSGMIAYDQKRPADARSDFRSALAGNPVNCPAMWYLGLLDVDERKWTPGRERFGDAAECYSRAVTSIESEEIAPDLSPEATAQQQDDRARRLADNQRQVARSALNAALLSAQIGDRDSVVRYAEIAATHELTRDRAQTLLRESR